MEAVTSESKERDAAACVSLFRQACASIDDRCNLLRHFASFTDVKGSQYPFPQYAALLTFFGTEPG